MFYDYYQEKKAAWSHLTQNYLNLKNYDPSDLKNLFSYLNLKDVNQNSSAAFVLKTYSVILAGS